jgi:Domain of unknown function (DUF1707)
VLPFPSDPGPDSAALAGTPPGGAGPGRPPGQRASDADRETAVDIMCAAVGDGRLTLAELDERVEAALSARTLTELATLIADLYPASPRAAAPRRTRERGTRNEWCGHARHGRPAGDRVNTADRWALLQSLAAPRVNDRAMRSGSPHSRDHFDTPPAA